MSQIFLLDKISRLYQKKVNLLLNEQIDFLFIYQRGVHKLSVYLKYQLITNSLSVKFSDQVC